MPKFQNLKPDSVSFQTFLRNCLLLLLSALAISVRAESNLLIKVGEPFTIAKSEEHVTWGYWNHPILQKCANGDLLLSFSTGEDAFMAKQTGTNFYRSIDQGKTWKSEKPWNTKALSPRLRESFLRFTKAVPPDALGGGDKGALSSFCNLSDGSCISFFYHTMRGETPDLFLDTKWTSKDGGKTWLGPADVELKIPNIHQDTLGRGPALWRSSVQIKNGDLVTVAHALFAEEKKMRVIALGSADKGNNWTYLGTVAYDPNIRTEGFTEPALCLTSMRRLLCVMRTEGAMMQQSFSDDGGKTWTPSASTGVEGVAPELHLLSNGVLACSYGRPGVNIMFSPDGAGNQWSHQTRIFSGVTAVNSKADQSTCYTSFAEISPARLLLVYDTIRFQDFSGAKPANCIRGVFIDLKR